MATNKNILFKGIRFLGIALPLLFIGPSVIHSSFKNKEHSLYYPILVLGVLCCALGIYFIFRGVTTMVKALFND